MPRYISDLMLTVKLFHRRLRTKPLHQQGALETPEACVLKAWTGCFWPNAGDGGGNRAVATDRLRRSGGSVGPCWAWHDRLDVG